MRERSEIQLCVCGKKSITDQPLSDFARTSDVYFLF
jgi:hypothetical protein